MRSRRGCPCISYYNRGMRQLLSGRKIFLKKFEEAPKKSLALPRILYVSASYMAAMAFAAAAISSRSALGSNTSMAAP